MYQEIETLRLSIRPIEVKDAEFINRLVNSSGWLTFIGDRNITNVQNAEAYIQNILDASGSFYSVFELKNTKEPLGVVTFLNRIAYPYPDIGFAMLPDFEGQGYAYEACRGYLDALLQSGTHENIIAITIPHNVKSISLLKKLGLTHAYNVRNEKETLSLFSLKAISQS